LAQRGTLLALSSWGRGGVSRYKFVSRAVGLERKRNKVGGKNEIDKTTKNKKTFARGGDGGGRKKVLGEIPDQVRKGDRLSYNGRLRSNNVAGHFRKGEIRLGRGLKVPPQAGANPRGIELRALIK